MKSINQTLTGLKYYFPVRIYLLLTTSTPQHISLSFPLILWGPVYDFSLIRVGWMTNVSIDYNWGGKSGKKLGSLKRRYKIWVSRYGISNRQDIVKPEYWIFISWHSFEDTKMLMPFLKNLHNIYTDISVWGTDQKTLWVNYMILLHQF